MALSGSALLVPSMAQAQFAQGAFLNSRHNWKILNPTALNSRLGPASAFCDSKILVLGGYDGGMTYFSDGYVFDIATNTWSSFALNQSVARQSGSLVWNGNRAILWGGQGAGGYLNTGVVMNPNAPATDTAMATANAPPGAVGHSIVAYSNLVYVWGGLPLNNTGAIYDVTSNSWTAMSNSGPVPQARSLHRAVVQNSVMIVWGGRNSGGTALSNGGRYDSQSQVWSPMANSPLTPRWGHSMLWNGNKILIWGGTNGSVYYSDGASYDPALDQWTMLSTAGSSPTARQGHSAVWTGRQMLIWGGSANGGTYFTDGSAYDPVSNTWYKLVNYPVAPTGRVDATAGWYLPRGQMVLYGGSTSSFWNNTTAAYRG